MEGESRLAQEGVDQVGAALDLAEAAANHGLEFVKGGGGVVAEAAFHAGPGAFSRFVTVHGSLRKRVKMRRLSAGRACFGLSSGPSGCEQATRREGRRRGRRGHPPQMTALTKVPETELWTSFPEATRSDVLGLLSMLLERLAVLPGPTAKETGGEGR